ncbi:MAG TPA: SUMF1/EgtB/PvdO family nonheme iron enzyme [Allocoleopsis sp.]
MKDVLISYTNTDRPWTEWMTWVLEENGYPVVAKLWDKPLANTCVEEMQQAIANRQHILIILSNDYLRSVVLQEQWVGALGVDLEAQNRSIIPIRVEDVELTRLMSPVMYVDLFDKSEAEAEQAILSALEERSEPDNPISLETTQTQTGQIEIEPQIDISINDQFKQQRQSHTVQFFLEQLTDDIGIEMMLIPAGTFMMGSPEDEIDRPPPESPQHEVSVPTFFMGKYPITQAQWRFVAELPQINRELNPNPSCFKGNKRPVEQIVWHDAVEFCDRLSTYTKREYRLPTEAEWEYACRAGTTTPFHFGETITTNLANYDGTDDSEGRWSGSYNRGPKGEYRKETTPVDYFGIANAFGLCDMHGNVWEWCLDHWHDNYEGAPTDGSVWLYEDSRTVRRGGSWYDRPRYCRSAYRDLSTPVIRTDGLGFRVVFRSNPGVSRSQFI